MANLKRNNHYLPVCYQKGFTDATEKVWVKFADRTKPEHRQPHSKVEDFFNQHVETPFAAVSQKNQIPTARVREYF